MLNCVCIGNAAYELRTSNSKVIYIYIYIYIYLLIYIWQESIDEEDDFTDTGGECTSQHQSEEVDSGLSKTDESIRNDESSEQDTDSPTGYSPHTRYDITVM